MVSYLGQLKHGFHGGLILNKVVLNVSIIGQVGQTLDGPLPGFGVNLGVGESPGRVTEDHYHRKWVCSVHCYPAYFPVVQNTQIR